MTAVEIINEQRNSPLKHSGLGVASFIMSLVMGVVEFFLVVIAGVLQATTPGGINEKSPVAVFLGLFLIGGLVISLVGAGLGVAGVIQKNRKKVLAILGLVFNGIIILGVIALMVIGSIMS